MSLFNGEKILEDFPASILTPRLTNEQINEKYTTGEVRIVTEQARYPINTIPEMLKSGNYSLRPDFQRRHRWSVERRSKLIESLIMNVPLPPIFLYEDRFSHYEVMDGLQRLTTIDKFYKDEFALTGLELWPELNSMKYSQLPEKVKSGIDRRYLSSIILLHETAKTTEKALELKQLVFERINSGGVKLSYQESRNSAYPGAMNNLCIKLSRDENFCNLFSIPTVDITGEDEIPNELAENDLFQSMSDVELVLRFFANRQKVNFDRGTLKVYFDYYLEKSNSFSPAVLSNLEDVFIKTCKLTFDIFGEKAFWLWRKRRSNWGWYTRPTTVLFDPIMYVISDLLDKETILISKKDEINKSITAFYEENYNLFEGRNTNMNQFNKRIELFSNFFNTFLD